MKTALSSAQGNLQKSMDKNEEWIRFKQEQETVQFVKVNNGLKSISYSLSFLNRTNHLI